MTLGIVSVAKAGHAQDLAPPPPLDPNAPGAPTAPDQQATVSQLDTAEREDSGRKFELVWVRGEVGGSYINMSQFSSSTFQVEKASSGGPMFGLAAGVRFVVFVLGARARYNALSAFNMWQLNGELGLQLPIKSFDLGFGLHGGYSFVGSLGNAALATNTNTPTNSDQVKVRGFNAGLDASLDYYITPLFSVGAGVFGDFLFLNRPPADLPASFSQLPADQQAAVKNDPLYAKSGTSLGFEAGGALRLGLHFGL